MPRDVGDEDLGQRAAADAVQLHVLDDANHLDPARRSGCARQHQTLAERRRVRPQLRGQLPVDNRDRPVVVVYGEESAGDERNAQRLEKTRERNRSVGGVSGWPTPVE